MATKKKPAAPRARVPNPAAQVKALLRENNQLTKAAARFREGYLAEYDEARRLASELAQARDILKRVLHCGSGCQQCQRDALRIPSRTKRKCGAS